MSELVQPLLLSSIAGFSVMIGVFIAFKFPLKEGVRAFLLSFTVGMILAAVCFDLMPVYGITAAMLPWVILSFLGGAVLFMLFDKYILAAEHGQEKIGTTILLAIILDDIAEGLVIGVTWLYDAKIAILMTGILALQNVVEGMVECAEEIQEGRSRLRIFSLNIVASFVPCICTVIAIVALQGVAEQHLCVIMFATAGALLYMTLTDLAPRARIEGNLAENLGAIVGFLLVYLITVLLKAH